MLVATPNLCVDRTVRLPRLRPGAVHRSGQAEVSAGGKGVNVARVLRAHGYRPVVAGLVPQVDGEQLRQLLLDEGADLLGVAVHGRARAASILLEDDGRVTVVNEPGPLLDDATWLAYRDAVANGLAGHDLLVCTGSLPPGAPDDGYAQLTAFAHERGAVAVVDAARGALAAALPARPDLVCPNLAEAEAVLAGSYAGPEHVDETAPDIVERGVASARALVTAGARRAVVTLGAAGAVLVIGSSADDQGAEAQDPAERLLVLAAPRVSVVSAVGAGDSFVGGLVVGLARGEDWVSAVRRGVATASASVEHVVAGGVIPARAEQLLRCAVAATTAGDVGWTGRGADAAVGVAERDVGADL